MYALLAASSAFSSPRSHIYLTAAAAAVIIAKAVLLP